MQVQIAIVIQLAEFDADEKVKYSKPFSRYPITYAGLNAEKLNIIFTAPVFHGIYRIAYLPTGYDEPAGSDELIVQQE